MTNIDHTTSISKLDLCGQDVFTFARKVSIVGGVLMFSGALGLVATMNQTTLDAPRMLFIAMVVLGPCGLFIGNKLIRILMKHHRTNLKVF